MTPSNFGKVRASACVAALLAAAASCAPSAGEPRAPTPSTASQQIVAQASTASGDVSLPVDPAVQPVSATNPGPEAAEVLAKCHIGDQIPIDRVTGMGKVSAASELDRYVPLTGREPQLRESGPAWVVTIDAAVPQPGSSETWIDPTCVVTGGDSGYFATGLVEDAVTGKAIPAEAPARSPEVRVPPLAP